MTIMLGAGLLKPRFRLPCNGCGICCLTEVCETMHELVSDAIGPCPALEFETGRYWCGLVRHPHKYLGIGFQEADTVLGPMVAEAIGVGQGCSMEDEGINYG